MCAYWPLLLLVGNRADTRTASGGTPPGLLVPMDSARASAGLAQERKMSFAAIKHRSGKKPFDGIKVTSRAKTSYSPGYIEFLIGEPQLKSLGWNLHDSILIEVGANEHDGQVRLTPGKGNTLFNNGSSSRAGYIRSAKLINDVGERRPAIAHHRIKGSTVTITMPDWWSAPTP